MRIVTQSEDAPSNIGGISTHVWELSRALVKLGHSVRILTTRKDVSRAKNLFRWFPRVRKDCGVEIYEIPIVYSPRMIAFQGQLQWRFIRKIRQWIAKGELDVLTFHFWDFDSRVVAPLAGTCPIVFTNHSSQFLGAIEDSANYNLLKGRIGFANVIIAPSIELKDKTQLLGYPSGRCSYIPNGVDPERFQPDPQKRRDLRESLDIDESHIVSLCARRAVWKNGLLPFARSLQFVKVPRRLRFTVLFAGLDDKSADGGDPSYADQVRRQLSKLTNSVEVRFLGRVPYGKIHEWMQAADFAVLPSFQEATSLAGLEAMACELPLVATRVGGIPELVDHEVNGLLVSPGDEEALVRAVNRMLQDVGFRREAGKAARQKVLKYFDWKSVAARTIKVYEQAKGMFHCGCKAAGRTFEGKISA